MPPRTGVGSAMAAAVEEDEDKAGVWEVTPGGMVVQRRNPDSGPPAAVVPTIRVKVKHGAVYHEIYISSQATFGEMKKMLSARVGMHPLDQKIIYKDKERDSAAFLDTAGIKDRSKVVLEEDATAKAKRLLEQRKADRMEKAAKAIAVVARDVDKLAHKVSAFEAIVNKGGRVVEDDVLRLIEMLMNELIKLDGVVADGDIRQQRKMQVKRVQKYVETLDLIKIKNDATPKANHQIKQQQTTQPRHEQRSYHRQQQRQSPPPAVTHPQHEQRSHHHRQQKQQPQPAVVTANWETFDSLLMPSTSTTSAALMAASSTATTRSDWELF